ncbi:MAG: hypothetical protein J7M08_04380 [Planctomycetes bacterium]|nr:hypothetical protein [Planctomycetota bacterium]
MRVGKTGRRNLLALVVLGCCLFLILAGKAQSRLTVLEVSGGPRARGLEHGRELAIPIKNMVWLAHTFAAGSPEELRQTASTFDKFISPVHREEMRGIAEGAGVPYEDVLALNCWYEISSVRPACRQVVALDEGTAGDGLLHGRNLDWQDYGGALSKNLVLLRSTDEKGRRIALLVWPGMIGSLTGTNDRGITVALNQLGVNTKPGEPVFLLMRRVLEEAGNLEDAVEMLRSAPLTAEVSIVISDARKNDAACVEWFMGGRLVGRPEKSVLVADNSPHFISHFGVSCVPQAETALWRMARADIGGLTVEKLERLLANPEVLLSCNLYSCVFAPRRNEVWVAAGQTPAASSRKYKKHILFPKD